MENFDSTIDWRRGFRDEIESAGPWILKDGHVNQVFSTIRGGSAEPKSRVVFSPDGHRVAASATDRVIFVETSGWTEEKEMLFPVTNLVVTPESDGYSFVCGSRGALIWISSKDLKITRQATLPHNDEVIGLLHDPDVVGRFYVLTPVDFCVFDGTTLVNCICNLSDTPTLAFAQSRRWVVFGGRKGRVFVVRKSDLKMEFEVQHKRTSDILSVCCNDDIVFRYVFHFFFLYLSKTYDPLLRLSPLVSLSIVFSLFFRLCFVFQCAFCPFSSLFSHSVLCPSVYLCTVPMRTFSPCISRHAHAAVPTTTTA